MAVRIHLVVSFILFIIFSVYSEDPHPIIDVCVQKSSCKCEYNNGEYVDLTALSNDNETAPRFHDMPSEILGGAKYSWNPCHSFHEGDTCNNVTLCEIIAGAPMPKYVPIGTLDGAVFDHNVKNGDLQLQYSVSGDENRTAFIILICDERQDGVFIVKGEEPAGSGLYFFELQSKHVCRSSPAPKIQNPDNGLSAGAVIAIIFGCLIGLYLFGGMAYQKLNGATGKEIIPNYHFWAAVGSSVKSGCLFVFTCGRKEYEEIGEKQRINEGPKL